MNRDFPDYHNRAKFPDSRIGYQNTEKSMNSGSIRINTSSLEGTCVSTTPIVWTGNQTKGLDSLEYILLFGLKARAKDIEKLNNEEYQTYTTFEYLLHKNVILVIMTGVI